MVQMTRRGIRTRLPNDFIPEKHTVLCGRGKEYTSSTGNQHLKSLVHKYLQPYSEAKSKVAKSSVVSEIMGQIKGLCSDAAFVKLEKDAWWEVDDAFAREKIGCMFRDTLHTKYRSSTKAKFARKKAKETKSRSDSSAFSLSSMADESVQSMVSTLSSSSAETCYSSDYAAEIFEQSCLMNAQKAEPTTFKPMGDYYSLLSSYLTFGPNQAVQQPQQQQPKKLCNPTDFCVMPMRPLSNSQPVQLDDIPDDLSGIFDDF
ncbi:unnamed protein product [Cylindrotheca closterium]|uniref:DUF6824 domain-containing protein n=1 Tax=Cylindrotheca closterium TaxID=2856 RepID=A0AAD2CD88_9STRA|nr:unnamed protein product [Cylindrotheca closterium]